MMGKRRLMSGRKIWSDAPGTARPGRSLATPLAGTLALLLLSACGGGGLEDGALHRSGDLRLLSREDVASVVKGPVEEGIPLSGSLDPYRRAQIRARIPGILEDVHVEQGTSVRSGEILASYEKVTLESQLLSARSAVAAAESSLATSEHNLQAAERLAGAGAISEQELRQTRTVAEAARAQVGAVQAQLRQAEEAVENATLRAPFKGVVSRRLATAGESVSPGQHLFEVVRIDTLELRAKVSAANLAVVQVGSPVSFQVDAYPGRDFLGQVDRVEPVADPSSRQITLYVRVPNRDGALVGGLYANGQILTTQQTEATLVPVAAVRGSDGEPFVLALEDGLVVSRPVVLGAQSGKTGWVRVQEGVAPGARVVVGPAGDLVTGMRVQVKDLPGEGKDGS